MADRLPFELPSVVETAVFQAVLDRCHELNLIKHQGSHYAVTIVIGNRKDLKRWCCPRVPAESIQELQPNRDAVLAMNGKDGVILGDFAWCCDQRFDPGKTHFGCRSFKSRHAHILARFLDDNSGGIVVTSYVHRNDREASRHTHVFVGQKEYIFDSKTTTWRVSTSRPDVSLQESRTETPRSALEEHVEAAGPDKDLYEVMSIKAREWYAAEGALEPIFLELELSNQSKGMAIWKFVAWGIESLEEFRPEDAKSFCEEVGPELKFFPFRKILARLYPSTSSGEAPKETKQPAEDRDAVFVRHVREGEPAKVKVPGLVNQRPQESSAYCEPMLQSQDLSRIPSPPDFLASQMMWQPMQMEDQQLHAAQWAFSCYPGLPGDESFSGGWPAAYAPPPPGLGPSLPCGRYSSGGSSTTASGGGGAKSGKPSLGSAEKDDKAKADKKCEHGKQICNRMLNGKTCEKEDCREKSKLCHDPTCCLNKVRARAKPREKQIAKERAKAAEEELKILAAHPEDIAKWINDPQKGLGHKSKALKRLEKFDPASVSMAPDAKACIINELHKAKSDETVAFRIREQAKEELQRWESSTSPASLVSA